MSEISRACLKLTGSAKNANFIHLTVEVRHRVEHYYAILRKTYTQPSDPVDHRYSSVETGNFVQITKIRENDLCDDLHNNSVSSYLRRTERFEEWVNICGPNLKRAGCYEQNSTQIDEKQWEC